MSSHDDIEAPEANIARFKALVDIQQEKLKELEQKNIALELDKRLSAPKLQDRATRPAVSTDSLDLTLQAELLQSRQDNAAKDEEISRLRASLRNCQSNLTSIKQGFIAINKSYHETTEDLSTAIQDIDSVLEADTALKELHSRPRSPVVDTAAESPQPSSSASKSEKITADTAPRPLQPSQSASNSEKNTADTDAGPPQPSSAAASKSGESTADTAPKPPQPSSSAPKPVTSMADTATGPPQPSSAAPKPVKSTADTAAEPPQPLSSALEPNKVAPDYALALSMPAAKLPRFPRARVPLAQSPLFARPPVTHANLAVKKEAADQVRSESERQKISQKPNRASTHGGPTRGKDARGRGSPRADKGETSRGSKSKRQRPLTTIHYLGSKTTHADRPEKPVESRGPTSKPEVKSSVTPATQGGRDALVNWNKDASSNPSPATTTRRRRKAKLSDETLAIIQRWGYKIPSETDTDDEQEAESKAEAPPVPATPQSLPPKVAEDRPQTLPSISHSHNSADLGSAAIADGKPAQMCQVQPAIPLEMMEPDWPVQQPEQEPNSNARKRLADEEQLGTSASSKRLRST